MARRRGVAWWRRPALFGAAILGIGVAVHLDQGAGAQAPIAGRPEKIQLVPGHPESRGPGRIRIVPDAAALRRLFAAGSARVAGFPLPGGQRVDLEIASFDLTGPHTRFLAGGAGGTREVAAPAMRFFRGQVAGDPGSLVSLNVLDGRISGFVRYDGREYTFGPRAWAPESPGADEIQMVDEAFEGGPTGTCDGDEEAGDVAAPAHGLAATPRPESLTAASIDSSTLLVGRIAVEGTVEWVTRHGGVSAATAYTLNLMAQVSAIYENEVKVRLQIPYILMNAAEPDGYTGGSNSTATVLGEMRARWNGTPSLQGVFRSAAHVFSTYPSGGSGRAYIDVLCRNVPVNSNASDYGVSLLEGNGGSWERRLVSHEIGHNFSSPHSHCYAPELDQCYNTEGGCYAGPIVQTTGTMMSYCNARVSSFHQRERDEKVRPGAQAAYPECMEVAGDPGDVGDLLVTDAGVCGAANLQADDNGTNGTYGYSGTIQGAWIKRFTPACYPFKLTGVDVRISNTTTVAPGRPIRILVYADPAGSGSPATSTLIRSQNVTVQVVGTGTLNQYTLTTPVILTSGDFYLGFYDLQADSGTTYLMDYDNSRSGDSWWQSNSTDPATFGLFTSTTGSWLIRGHGGGVNPGSVVLAWDPPCNDATVPGQDFAVYQGSLGDWNGFSSLTCTTAHERTWLVESPPPGTFWVIVPQTSSSEGSYGQSSSGERSPALSACKPQAIAICQ